MKTEIQNTLAEDLGMFFTLKFGECIIHPLPSDSSETTNVFYTKGEMNSKKSCNICLHRHHSNNKC